METGMCKYTASGAGHESEERSPCDSPVYKDGMCKFHLDGYLNEGTADEVRGLFWEKHDGAGAARTMNCTGYILPSLAQQGKERTVKRQLLLDAVRFKPTGADFSKITFERPVSFRGAKFGAGVNFSNCTFKEGVDFSRAEFLNGHSKFNTAKFHKTADFFMTKFDEVSFDWASFEKIQFKKARFENNASFYRCVFDSMANFYKAQFLGKVSFNESEIHSDADFSDAQFKESMEFRDVKMRNSTRVRFDGNVSNVSFLNTDVKEITLGSKITWSPSASDDKYRSRLARFWQAKNKPKAYSAWNKKWRIYDEKMLDSANPDSSLNVENITNTYRDLRDNFDRQLRYNVSGGLFVREMEMGRKYKNDENGHVVQKSWHRRVLTWHAAYNLISEYGQSLGRPLFFLALVIGASSVLLWCPATVLQGLDIHCEDDLSDSILRSLVSAVPLPVFGADTHIDIVLKAATLPSLATFLVALRRRFEKSRRH